MRISKEDLVDFLLIISTGAFLTLALVLPLGMFVDPKYYKLLTFMPLGFLIAFITLVVFISNKWNTIK